MEKIQWKMGGFLIAVSPHDSLDVKNVWISCRQKFENIFIGFEVGDTIHLRKKLC